MLEKLYKSLDALLNMGSSVRRKRLTVLIDAPVHNLFVHICRQNMVDLSPMTAKLIEAYTKEVLEHERR